MMILPYILIGAGMLCFLYFIILRIFCGWIPAFGWFWPVLGGIFIAVGLTGEEMFMQIFAGIMLILAVCAEAWMNILRNHGNKKAQPGADYVIVLGARVNGSVPSKALRSRIMEAFHYLEQNPMTKAVLTGGQGPGEDISEADCMMRELIQLGVAEERLILEQKSGTTQENIRFARDLIGISTKEKELFVVIVTNDFHALRGKVIGKRMGFARVESLGAPSSKVMRLHYYTRETLSWVKWGISLMFHLRRR